MAVRIDGECCWQAVCHLHGHTFLVSVQSDHELTLSQQMHAYATDFCLPTGILCHNAFMVNRVLMMTMS